MTDPLNEGAKPWPLFGYAPGSYQCVCAICGETFEGDKRAAMCLECAAAAANSILAAAPANTGEAVAPTEVSALQAQIKTGNEPELTCPHIDAFIEATNPPVEVRAEFDKIKWINSNLRMGLWHEKERANATQAQIKALTEELDRLRSIMEHDPKTIMIAYQDGDHERLARAASVAIERADAAEARATEAERQLAEGVPDGWKLVPIEPTEAMRKAFINKWVTTSPDEFDAPYAAMLAASPTPSKRSEE